MWHKLQDYPPYFLQTNQRNGFEVFVTDHITIWFINYSNKSLLACLQHSNFGLEVDENEFIQKGTELLFNPTGLKSLIITKGASSLEVSLTKLFEYPLKIKLKLVEGSKEMFFQNVTQLLIRNISDLKASQQELRKLLTKKDDEIDEYKSEGKEIAIIKTNGYFPGKTLLYFLHECSALLNSLAAARYLKTKKFNEEEHMKQHQVFVECGELLDVPLSVLEKLANETSNLKNQNSENSEVKLEPEAPIKCEIVESVTSSSNSSMQVVKSECTSNSTSPRKKRKPMLNY